MKNNSIGETVLDEFRYEVIDKITELKRIGSIWNRLANTMKEGVVCHSYEWFECWYSAFCKPGNERIILVYHREQLRAILPGMITKKKFRILSCTVFSYAGNGHSPRCGVIAASGDMKAIFAAINCVNKDLVRTSFDFIVFPGVMLGTDTHRAIQRNSLGFKTHVEHSFESPTCNISEGWEKYLESRSKSMNGWFRKAFKKAQQMGGEPVFHIVPANSSVGETIERLSSVDSTTWQYKNGTGLFSTRDNRTFYKSLISLFMPTGLLKVAFISIAKRDISYRLVLKNKECIFSIKSGYDPEFRKCNPGILVLYSLLKNCATEGFSEFDLLGETSDEKKKWATNYQKHSNFWIFQTHSAKGVLVRNALGVKSLVKKLIKFKYH